MPKMLSPEETATIIVNGIKNKKTLVHTGSDSTVMNFFTAWRRCVQLSLAQTK